MQKKNQTGFIFLILGRSESNDDGFIFGHKHGEI